MFLCIFRRGAKYLSGENLFWGTRDLGFTSRAFNDRSECNGYLVGPGAISLVAAASLCRAPGRCRSKQLTEQKA